MKPRPAPVDGEPPPKAEPDDGNTISTVRVLRSSTTYVTVEHPESWGADEVLAALTSRMMDFGSRVGFYDADSRTKIKDIAIGENEPDQPCNDPFPLTDDDLDGDIEDEESTDTQE